MKNIYYIIFYILLFSCKSQQVNFQSVNSHLLLEQVLNKVYSNNQKSKNLELFTKEINESKLKEYIKTIKLIDEANDDISIDSTWFNSFSKTVNNNESWNPSLLGIQNLNTEFKLNEKENIDLLNSKIDELKLEQKEQYKERVMLWVKENRTFNIVSTTPVIYSENIEKALIFTSIYNSGLTAWLFEKQNEQWNLVLNLDIAIY